MQVYLTGVHTVKKPKSISEGKIKSKFSQPNNKEKIEIDKEFDKESNIILEDVSSENDKIRPSKVISNRTLKHLKKNLNDIQKDNNINIKNNFISKDDKNKTKKNFICEKDFNSIYHQNSEQKKNNQLMINELKEEYLEYIMLKEPKYADFDKISDDQRKKIYLSYQRYNNNLLIIARKKEEKKTILSEIEKSLINNYYLKDSSMLPIYEQLIEKVKLDILTKQQEFDGYHKIYEEIYNHNYTIKRKVLDEIDIDRVNEDFYDQYKILKNHAIVQVSKKQDSLNQVEEYQKKMLEEHEKEIKQKNKILKDLKLQIEVFKEDEKDLVNKLKKLKIKRENVNKSIKEKEKKIENINIHYKQNIRRYQKSFIGMNKIFKSVNAKNLDDVLYDVNYIKSKFNKLKNNIINMNLDISNLNSEYSQLGKILNDINKEIILTKNKNKNSTVLNQKDQKRLIEIKNELKKINENENRIKEIIQNNIGTFQQGITFIFQKTKSLINNITFLKKIISPKFIDIINQYKNNPFSLNYEKIDKEFLTYYTFLFFQFSNILFYLSLRSMTSDLNINELNRKEMIISIYNKESLNLCQIGLKKALKEYRRRTVLKNEKQKEITIKTKKKEIEQTIDDKLMKENKAITQNQMFSRFIDYLHNKDGNSCRETKNQNEYTNINISTNKNSIFFTGIDSMKKTNSKNFDNSSTNSNYSETMNKLGKNKKVMNTKEIFTFKQKEDFLQKNKNKIMNIFSKYQNSLVKEIDKNLYFQKKYLKKLPRARSQEKFIKYPNEIRNSSVNKKKIIKEENLGKKISLPNLLDENYEYDEDDDEEEKKRKRYIKKNKSFTHFSFFKLNKDRANIYKKMNDLGKLQMAYFGGRFLNTKITSGMNNTYGEQLFDEFLKRQNKQNNFEIKENKRKLNLGKKLVEKITANQKLRNKTPNIGKNYIKVENNDLFYNKGSKKNQLRKIDENTKRSFSFNIKKSTMASTKNNRSINKYRKLDNNKTFSKTKNSYYKTISIRKNFIQNDKSVISNYYSKK